jgi:HSP20 family molecular chaperone IbpA
MNTLTLWSRTDPFADFDALVRRAFGPTGSRAAFTPAADLDRDGDDAVLRLELPGVDPEKDVVVEVERGQLVVRGERRDERTEDRDGLRTREVRYGSFRRAFGLPAHVTAEALSASYDAGVLTVRVKDAYAGTAAKRIEVAAGGDRELDTPTA